MNETSLHVAVGTAAQETTLSALDGALNLLTAWNLPQLCENFREQEVCTNALLYLTERDIMELIPKIGPRAIFSARLREWRKAYGGGSTGSGGGDAPGQQVCHTGEQFQELLGAVKMEMSEAEQHWLNDVSEMQGCQVTMTTGSDTVVPEDNPVMIACGRPEIANGEMLQGEIPPVGTPQGEMHFTTSNKQAVVNVREILMNNLYGLKAIEFYQAHNELGAIQRKKIVEVVIGNVMEQHIVMSSQCFMDLAKQVIALFPAENIETYYIPRVGLTCPKGALYNKYLNMGKALRRSGLLEYRVGRRAKHNMCKSNE